MIKFRKLKENDRIKAINNAYRHGGIDWLMYLFIDSPDNISGWFDFETSKEGLKYWANIDKKQNNEN